MKHQTERYRVINGRKMINYCDLIMGDAENETVIEEAKKLYKYTRKIKHPDGFYQLFVANN